MANVYYIKSSIGGGGGGGTKLITYNGPLSSLIFTPYLGRHKTKTAPLMMHNVSILMLCIYVLMLCSHVYFVCWL